jgi:hypothetical protein
MRSWGSSRFRRWADRTLHDARDRDQASFESPDRFPTGIEKVFVNCVPVVDGDRYDANPSAGQVLRS